MAHLITDHYLMMVCTAPPAQKKKQWMMPFILLKGALTQKNVPGVIFFSDPIFFAQSFPVTIFYFADFTDTDLRCRWPYILTDVREKHHEVRQLDFREQGNSNPGEFGVKIVATWFYFVSGKFECKVLQKMYDCFGTMFGLLQPRHLLYMFRH